MLAVPRLRLFILNDRKYVHSAVLCAPSLRPSLYNTSVILVAPNREHVSVKVIALYTSTHVTKCHNNLIQCIILTNDNTCE